MVAPATMDVITGRIDEQRADYKTEELLADCQDWHTQSIKQRSDTTVRVNNSEIEFYRSWMLYLYSRDGCFSSYSNMSVGVQRDSSSSSYYLFTLVTNL